MVATESSDCCSLSSGGAHASCLLDEMATRELLKHSRSSEALLEGPVYPSMAKSSVSSRRNHREADESVEQMLPFRKNASEDSVVVVGLARDEHHPRPPSRGLHGDDVVHEGHSSARMEKRHRSRAHHDEFGRSGSRRHLGIGDRVDPEDSIKDMVIENDFYRYVLFKRHYEKYVSISKKYEEAKNMVYYLEEKYHEVKAELDEVTQSRRDLEDRLEQTEMELHDKEEELFLQLERVVRLEEECEKLRREAAASEARRRELEAARWDVVRQMAVVSSERENLEKENEMLRGSLSEERKELGHYIIGLDQQKSTYSQKLVGLEKQVTELRFAARQTASLNSHLKKGMKHLASCKKRKCSVCHYTRTIFGEYDEGRRSKLFSCIQSPLQEVKNWIIRPITHSESSGDNEGKDGSDGSIISDGRATPSGDASSPFSITPSASLGCLLHSTAIDTSSQSPQALEPAHLLSSLPLTYCSCHSFCKRTDEPCGSSSHCCPMHPDHSPTIDISYIDDSCPSVEGVTTGLEDDDGVGGQKSAEAIHSNGGLCLNREERVVNRDSDYISTSDIVPSKDKNDEKNGHSGSCQDGTTRLKGAPINAISFSCTVSQASPFLPLMENSQTSTSPSESEPPRPSTKSSGVLSSDSGFSSELFETPYCPRVVGCRRLTGEKRSEDRKGDNSTKDVGDVGCASSGGFTRSKWTTSFRKLIHRVSKK